MSVSWNEYLKLGNAGNTFNECRRKCEASFAQHRRNIQCAIEATHPKTIACLGAGVLNDIPYECMVRSGAHIHLVDWIPGSIRAGIDQSIVQTGQDGRPRCIYCSPAVQRPEAYCRRYQPSSPTSSVYGNFAETPGRPLRCAAFEKSDRPSIHCEDVTAGYASKFGREILDQLEGVRTWKQAFARAASLAGSIRNHRCCTAIAEGSVDLVTSSMVVSQFDHEPYEYFAHRTADRLGRPATKEETRLIPVMSSLRATLFTEQVTRHCEEILRLMAPGGYCYMSFELFHLVRGTKPWFLVEGMPRALEIVGRSFLFNFDILPEHQVLTRFQTGDTPSLVFSFMLTARDS